MCTGEFLINSKIIRGFSSCFIELGVMIYDTGILLNVQGVDNREKRSKIGRERKF